MTSPIPERMKDPVAEKNISKCKGIVRGDVSQITQGLLQKKPSNLRLPHDPNPYPEVLAGASPSAVLPAPFRERCRRLLCSMPPLACTVRCARLIRRPTCKAGPAPQALAPAAANLSLPAFQEMELYGLPRPNVLTAVLQHSDKAASLSARPQNRLAELSACDTEGMLEPGDILYRQWPYIYIHIYIYIYAHPPPRHAKMNILPIYP